MTLRDFQKIVLTRIGRVSGTIVSVIVLACAAIVLTTPTAHAATVATYVDPYGKGYQDVPGAVLVLNAQPGQKHVLWHSTMSVVPAEPMNGVNAMVNVAIRCFTGTGTTPIAGEQGTHWSRNMDGDDPSDVIHPNAQWVFSAPHTTGVATYTCRLQVLMDTTDRTVNHDFRVESATGTMTLNVRTPPTYDAIQRWTLPETEQQVIANRTEVTLGSTYNIGATDQRQIAIRQKAQVTQCHSADVGCAGHAGSTNSTVRSWITLTPRNSAGAQCAAVITSPVVTSVATFDHHHYTLTNAINLARPALPAGCQFLRAALNIQHVSGTAIRLDAGLSNPVNDRGTAYSHGFAFRF